MSWPWCPFKGSQLTLRLFSNKNSLCKIRMALPSQSSNSRPSVDIKLFTAPRRAPVISLMKQPLHRPADPVRASSEEAIMTLSFTVGSYLALQGFSWCMSQYPPCIQNHIHVHVKLNCKIGVMGCYVDKYCTGSGTNFVKGSGHLVIIQHNY